MNVTRYLLRSVVHHRHAHLGTLAGAILGATVLLGALFAGDSVRASLRRIAAERNCRAVLLSPACASFDQYRDFEARGEHFRQLVQSL